MQGLTGLASAFAPDFISLLILRGIFGVFCGITIPLMATYICEVT